MGICAQDGVHGQALRAGLQAEALKPGCKESVHVHAVRKGVKIPVHWQAETVLNRRQHIVFPFFKKAVTTCSFSSGSPEHTAYTRIPPGFTRLAAALSSFSAGLPCAGYPEETVSTWCRDSGAKPLIRCRGIHQDPVEIIRKIRGIGFIRSRVRQ